MGPAASCLQGESLCHCTLRGELFLLGSLPVSFLLAALCARHFWASFLRLFIQYHNIICCWNKEASKVLILCNRPVWSFALQRDLAQLTSFQILPTAKKGQKPDSPPPRSESCFYPSTYSRKRMHVLGTKKKRHLQRLAPATISLLAFPDSIFACIDSSPGKGLMKREYRI